MKSWAARSAGSTRLIVSIAVTQNVAGTLSNATERVTQTCRLPQQRCPILGSPGTGTGPRLQQAEGDVRGPQ